MEPRPDDQLASDFTIEIDRIPQVPTADLSVYWHTAETETDPFVEVDGYRFRRNRSGLVGIEAPSAVGGWVRWWIDPNVPYVMMSLTDDMALPLILGQCAAGTLGAQFLEQYAPEAVALARYGAGMINGVQTVCLHVATPDGNVATTFMAPLSQPLQPPVGPVWVEATSPAVEACHRVVQACGDLGVAVSNLTEAEGQRLMASPQFDWRAQLRETAEVSRDAKAVLDLINGLADAFSG